MLYQQYLLKYMNSFQCNMSLLWCIQSYNCGRKLMHCLCGRSGSTRATTGIVMWSKVYPLWLQNGQEVVVAVVDTQVLKTFMTALQMLNFSI